MGKILPFSRSLPQERQFVLVLAKNEMGWMKVARELEPDTSRILASYYLTEQLGFLRQSGLLADYSACLVVGGEGIGAAAQQELEWLMLRMPVLLIKASDNVFDLGLEHLNLDTLAADELGAGDLPCLIEERIADYLMARDLRCLWQTHLQQRRVKQANAADTFMAVADADCADAEHFVADIVESLRVVARTRGIDLDWEPQGESLPVLLHKQQAKRYLIDLFLEIFDVYTRIKVMTSPRSLMCDSSVWLDIVASAPRFSDRFVPELSEAFTGLRRTLHLNQGDLFLVDQNADSLVIRLECRLSEA